MALAAITFLQNRQEITGLTHDAAWRLVDISGSAPAGAAGAIIACENTHASNTYTGGILSGTIEAGSLATAQSISVFNLNTSSSLGGTFREQWAEMDGSGQVYIRSQNAALKFYVVGWLDANWNFRTTMPSIGALSGSYADHDITGLLEAGDGGNVECAVVNLFGSTIGASVRPNGSTVSFDGSGLNSTHALVAVDASDIFEAKKDNAFLGASAYLVAYRKVSTGVTMFTNPPELSPTEDDTWNALELTDLSAIGKVALLTMNNSDSAVRTVAVREPGSTDPATYQQVRTNRLYRSVGVDGSQNVEILSENVNGEWHLLGYVEQDTVAPTVTITSPTSSATYETGDESINLGGTASDNVAVTSVTWSNSAGGSGTATGTTTWTITGISLVEGENVITVTAADAEGNEGTDVLTVTYAPVVASAGLTQATDEGSVWRESNWMQTLWMGSIRETLEPRKRQPARRYFAELHSLDGSYVCKLTNARLVHRERCVNRPGTLRIEMPLLDSKAAQINKDSVLWLMERKEGRPNGTVVEKYVIGDMDIKRAPENRMTVEWDSLMALLVEEKVFTGADGYEKENLAAVSTIVGDWITGHQVAPEQQRIRLGAIDAGLARKTTTIKLPEGGSILQGLNEVKKRVGGVFWVDPVRRSFNWNQFAIGSRRHWLRTSKNLSVLDERRDFRMRATRLYIYGAGSTASDRVTPTGGNPIIASTEGARVIPMRMVLPNVSKASELFDIGKSIIERLAQGISEYSIRAIDLSKTEFGELEHWPEIDAIEPGHAIHISDVPTGAEIDTVIESITDVPDNPIHVTLTVFDPSEVDPAGSAQSPIGIPDWEDATTHLFEHDELVIPDIDFGIDGDPGDDGGGGGGGGGGSVWPHIDNDGEGGSIAVGSLEAASAPATAYVSGTPFGGDHGDYFEQLPGAGVGGGQGDWVLPIKLKNPVDPVSHKSLLGNPEYPTFGMVRRTVNGVVRHIFYAYAGAANALSGEGWEPISHSVDDEDIDEPGGGGGGEEEGPGGALPSISITSPTSESTYETSESTLAISGAASSNVTEVTWTNDRGGSGTASGTDTWSVTGINLQAGVNVITVTAVNEVENEATDTLTVTKT